MFDEKIPVKHFTYKMKPCNKQNLNKNFFYIKEKEL